jgi:hypothetical protein
MFSFLVLQLWDVIIKYWKMLIDLFIAGFEVFMAVTMKNSFFWDVARCGSYKYRRFRGTYGFHHQGGKNQRARNNVNTN